MVTMKIDATGVDPSKSSGFEPYEGPLPRPGVYAATIQRMTIRISQNGNPYFNVLFLLDNQLTEEKQKCKGYPQWDKVVPGESDFQKERVGKLVYAVCGKVKANVSHDEVTDGGVVHKVGGKDPVGTKVKLVIARDTFNGEPTTKVADTFPWPKDEPWPDGDVDEDDEDNEDIEEEEDDEVEEDEDLDEDEVEDEESEDEEDEEEDDEEEEEDDGEYEEREEELNGMTRVQLKKELAEVDPDFKVLKKHKTSDLVEAILEAEFGEEDDEDPF